MKKMMLVLLLSLLLVGCQSNQTQDLNHIKTELEGIGYVFEQRDADSLSYYNNKAVNEEYDIDVTLVDLYIGYVNETQGWLELLVFESETHAETYVEATSDSGYIIYREGSVLFITFSQDAMSPFIESGSKTE